jgi:hypothetical protein
MPIAHSPKDRNGNAVQIGTRVRLLSLSRRWIDDLPHDEKHLVLSMIGEVFEIEEIDEYGKPWVRKSWPNEEEVPASRILSRLTLTKWKWSMRKRSNKAIEGSTEQRRCSVPSSLRSSAPPHCQRSASFGK